MPSDSMKQISLQEEYNKDTGVTSQDIAALREWLLTQPHLPEKYITDLDLILAYHCCNRSTGFTKEVIDLNFTLRSFLNAFKDRKIDRHILNVASNVLITPLPTRTKEGYKILFAHIINTDVKVFNFGDCVKLSLMIIDICQYEEGTWPGMLLVIDFEGLTIGHLTKIDIINLQQFLYYLQEALLVKLKGLHYINAPSFIDRLLVMMRPFMKKELMAMLHIHTTGSEKMEQYIPVEALPEGCGGSGGTVDEYKDEVISKLNAYKEYFELDKHKKVTESLRPGKPKTITDIFGGVEGSFKQLEID